MRDYEILSYKKRELGFIEQNKEQIANLERQKIAIKDQLEFETKTKRIIELDEQLYEIEDTIKKLTQGNRIAWLKNEENKKNTN